MKTNHPIVCGTDFSAIAQEGANAAGALAKRLGTRLVLVHGIDERGEIPASYETQLRAQDGPALAAEAARLRQSGIEVQEELAGGVPDDGVAKCAERLEARLIVIGSAGKGTVERWVLGSAAEAIAESAPVPTLVVREAAPIEAWARGERKLKVVVGTDFGASSDAALRWVATLREIGPCEIIAGFVAWPPEEAARLGLSGSARSADSPEIQGVLERDLRAKATRFLGAEDVRVRVHGAWGRADLPLVELAVDEQVDLLVVGTHQWHGLHRLRTGSVSRSILRHAPMSVACVPTPAAQPICVGSHTRPGLTAKLFGSVSLAVMQHSRRPVLAVWPSAE